MRLTTAQRAERAAAAAAEKKAKLDAKLGFRRMWSLLTQSKKPIVVHNGL
jgi:hypothetical protein